MTSEARWHPDLLRRFVATPYIFRNGNGSGEVRVESNDLEIALTVRSAEIGLWAGVGGVLCRLIRDRSAPTDGAETLLVSNHPIRTLHYGRGTILIHDHARSELLGFISSNVKAEELVSSLIPTLL